MALECCSVVLSKKLEEEEEECLRSFAALGKLKLKILWREDRRVCSKRSGEHTYVVRNQPDWRINSGVGDCFFFSLRHHDPWFFSVYQKITTLITWRAEGHQNTQTNLVMSVRRSRSPVFQIVNDSKLCTDRKSTTIKMVTMSSPFRLAVPFVLPKNIVF